MDQARWQTGLMLGEFVNSMQTHQAAMQRRLREVRLAEADRADFARLISPIHTLVMTEDWCGDGRRTQSVVVAGVTPKGGDVTGRTNPHPF